MNKKLNCRIMPIGYGKASKEVRDYITNLQQENERLQAIWKDTNVIIKDDKTLVMNTNAYDYLQDYKSRCEKAIDKLTIKQARFINEPGYIIDDLDLDEIMNILQNGSENDEQKNTI